MMITNRIIILSGANVVRYLKIKIRNRLLISFLRIYESDPVGIQTQDLQNRNLTLYSAKLRDLAQLKADAKVRLFSEK